MALDWRGKQIAGNVARAAMLAVDKTMAECVIEAKHDHPYENQTGTAEGSVRIAEFAVHAGPFVRGQWGSADVNYFVFLEIGTSVSGMTARERVEEAHGLMGQIAPPVGPLMAPRPSLRPAADRQYPMLRARIRQALSGQALT